MIQSFVYEIIKVELGVASANDKIVDEEDYQEKFQTLQVLNAPKNVTMLHSFMVKNKFAKW